MGTRSTLNDALDTMLVASTGEAVVEGARGRYRGIITVETVMNAITELRRYTPGDYTPVGNNTGEIPVTVQRTNSEASGEAEGTAGAESQDADAPVEGDTTSSADPTGRAAGREPWNESGDRS